jgi:xanthine/CO dehydrogenase XdhC/CoxF family maturation factor
MSRADDCFNDIVALVRREDAAAIDRATDKANAYLAGFGSRTAVERRSLAERLRRDGPDSDLMERVAVAIEASA